MNWRLSHTGIGGCGSIAKLVTRGAQSGSRMTWHTTADGFNRNIQQAEKSWHSHHSLPTERQKDLYRLFLIICSRAS
jgi:hypothetical protein